MTGAFTLMETLVVLLVSGLLLGIVYGSLRAVEHRYLLFLADSRRQLEISSLRALLQRDTERARMLAKSGNTLKMDFGVHSAEYLFLDSTLVRIQGAASDTFRLAPDSLAFSWRGGPLAAPDGLVEEFSFIVRNHDETYVFRQRKIYDSRTLWEMDRRNPQASELIPASPGRQSLH